MTLLGAFIGAIVYGRVGDRVGRKKLYGLEAAIMVVAALASAFSPDGVFLIICRFILGLGVGGTIPSRRCSCPSTPTARTAAS